MSTPEPDDNGDFDDDADFDVFHDDDVRESDEVGEQDPCQAYDDNGDDDNGDDNAGDDDNGDNGEVTVGALCSEIGSGRGAGVDKVGEQERKV